MKILQIGELYKFGGASEIMKIISEQLNKEGNLVISIYGYNPRRIKVEENDYVIYDNKYSIFMNRIFRYLREKFNLINWYSYLKIKRLIKIYKIDIIHLHAIQGGFLGLREVKKLCRSCKIIWTVHDTWLFTGGCMYFWDCNEWSKSMCAECNNSDLQMLYINTKTNLLRKYEAISKRNITFVAPSKWMNGNLNKSVFRNEKIFEIDNGIDLETFIPLSADKGKLRKKYGICNNKRILLFSASYISNPYKGWRYLREAMQISDNSDQYELVILGNETLDINISVSAVSIGYVEDKKIINELYNAADILILPSIQDNFPTITLEAQAAGLPVVAFATGGIVEQISNETGWIVTNKNAVGLLEMIESIFSNYQWKEIIREKGENARKRCEELYNQKNMIEKYKKLYMESR